MRVSFICFVLVVLCSAKGSEPDKDRVKQQFKSDNYTVTWGNVPSYEPEAELEIGTGSGHGGTLDWIRFQPGKGRVDVISIQFDKGWSQYKSKWPPDRAPVVVKSARLKLDAYATILRDLAVVDSASLKPIERNSFSFSSSDFWVYARLTTNKQTLIDYNWAGYEGGHAEINYAKQSAAVRLVREAVKGLEFMDHVLTDDERAWASAKFARDWKVFKGLKFHWWVRERYIETVGVVGDKSALPVLGNIMGNDLPKEEPSGGSSDWRCVYHAINAVTRLTKKDVRDKPVEEMDVEKTRQKVLDLIKVTK